VRDLVALPKAHLHVHLESAVRPATIAELADAHGIALPGRQAAFTGFHGFADYNAVLRSCLRRPEDFTRVAAEFCVDQAAEGVRYVEVSFTAAAHGERLGDPEMPLLAVLDGLVPSFDAHPLPRLRDAGLVVTLNTDIPTVIGTTLPDEYVRVRAVFGCPDAILAELAQAGVSASFASPATRARISGEIDAWSVSSPPG
jgi:adenosine deaminase